MKLGEKIGKGFCTKYALTAGIFEVGAGTVSTSRESRVYPSGVASGLEVGSEWFQTREAAESNARSRAHKKIDSLKRQIAALEKLTEAPKWREKKR